MADETKKGALCAMVELFGRRLFDMMFVISEYLQLHPEETASSLKALLENRNKTFHPVLLYRQVCPNKSYRIKLFSILFYSCYTALYLIIFIIILKNVS